MAKRRETDKDGDAAGKVPLSEHVYREIQRWINEGRFHPGERLRETSVCEELNVSRTPVREAIRRMQAEGRVVMEPQRGAIIAELNPQEVAELYMVRQEFEGFAARLAAQHACETEIRLINDILEESKPLAGHPRALNENNWKLHKAIYSAAHNRFVTRIFNALADSMALLRGGKYIPEDRPQELYAEHLAIVEAIAARDPDAADRAAQDHIRHSFRIHLAAALEQ